MVRSAIDALVTAGVLALHTLLHLSRLTAVGALGHHVLEDTVEEEGRKEVEICHVNHIASYH